jgi:hypothetical protein
MININTFAEEVAIIYNKQFDEPYLEFIKSLIIGYRATILKQEYDKYGRFPAGSEESICLPLKRVSPVECCVGEDLDCRVARTVDKVPSQVRNNFNSEPFLFVGTGNMEKSWSFANSDAVKHILEGSRFMSSVTFYTFLNGYIYAFNTPNEKVGIRLVASNPFELLELKNCDGKPCKEEVLIEDDMKRLIHQFITERLGNPNEPIDDREIKINE